MTVLPTSGGWLIIGNMRSAEPSLVSSVISAQSLPTVACTIMDFGKVLLDNRVGELVIRKASAALSYPPKKTDILLWAGGNIVGYSLKNNSGFQCLIERADETYNNLTIGAFQRDQCRSEKSSWSNSMYPFSR